MNEQTFEPSPGPGQIVADQVAALCWRRRKGRLGKDRLEVLLITSRETGRWVIPKGWQISGMSAADAAAREAWEEAGVQGRVQGQPLGEYLYDKITNSKSTGPATIRRCTVTVFALQVDGLKDRFPEASQRRLKWFAPAQAAALVAEPDLRALLSLVADHPGRLSGQSDAGAA